MGVRIVFHLPARHQADWRTQTHLALFRRIEESFAPLGARILVRDRRERPFQGGATRAYDDGDLHILDTGRARGAGVLNASIAYLPPFWHLDPMGMQAESSIGARAYDPQLLPHKPAMAFFERLRARYTLARKSRRDQPQAISALPKGAVSIFLQGSQPVENGLTFCGALEMIETVARGAGGRAVLVKPHPLALEADSRVIALALERGLAITPCHANVVDMIASSVATVSFNSACAIEGFLQRKPALLFGRSDFHHFAHSVPRAQAFPEAFAAALARKPEGYAKFLFWYFARNCLNLHNEDFAARCLGIFAAQGFDAARLGIAPLGPSGA